MIKKELINLKEFFMDSNEINNCLKKVEDEYRPNSAANYLYNLILKEHIDNKCINIKNRCFIDLIWATLDAWNMNSRSAKLADIEDFKKNLIDNTEATEAIESLKKYSIEDLSEKNDKSKGIFEQLKTLFNMLKLTDTDTKLVTFSKTMHFLLPNLIVPIDRKYTLKFFELNINNAKDEEFDHFTNIESTFGLFASEVNLDDFVSKNSKWCKYKTKIIDNIIIGYVKKEQNNIIEFWTKFNTVLEVKNFPFKMRKAKNYQRYQVELGTTQYAINIELVNSDHRIRSDHKIRVNVNIQKNNDLYDFFFEHKSEIESKLGYELTWDRKDDKSSSICTYIDGLDYDNKSNYQNLMEQIITKTREIRAVFSDLIQSYKNNEVEPK
jgi:hypothetical protein